MFRGIDACLSLLAMNIWQERGDKINLERLESLWMEDMHGEKGKSNRGVRTQRT